MITGHKDLALVSCHAMRGDGKAIFVSVFTNSWMSGNVDCYGSDLAAAIETIGEEEVFGNSFSKIEALFDRMRGDYEAVPAILFYTFDSDTETANIEQVVPLEQCDIWPGIEAMERAWKNRARALQLAAQRHAEKGKS